MNPFRHSGQPSIQLSPRGGKSNCFLSLWEKIEVRVSRNPANKIMLVAFLLIANSSAHAAELGRLFYTPQQRAQLEAQQFSTGTTEGGSRNYIMVNGVIQKHGGKRIVWINGTQQPAGNGNDKTPSTVPVTVPGKTQPVQVKVGQRLVLDKVVPEDK